MSKVRTIARAGGVEIFQDANGVISVHHSAALYVVDAPSVYEAIRSIQTSPETRAELLKQWAADIDRCAYAERQTRGD